MAPAMKLKKSFLNLPAELRNRIYHLVVVKKEPIRLSEERFIALDPPITATNWQVRDETIPIFYSSNTFQTIGHTPGDTEVTKRFLWSCSDGKLPLFRSIKVDLGLPSIKVSIWAKGMGSRAIRHLEKDARKLLRRDALLYQCLVPVEDGAFKVMWVDVDKLDELASAQIGGGDVVVEGFSGLGSVSTFVIHDCGMNDRGALSTLGRANDRKSSNKKVSCQTR